MHYLELDCLVEEATVDCNNETEQVFGLYTMIEDNLSVPFETIVFGSKVVVKRIHLTDRDDIVAICRRVANCGRFGCLIFRCLLLRRRALSGLRRFGTVLPKEAKPVARTAFRERRSGIARSTSARRGGHSHGILEGEVRTLRDFPMRI
jgi:hypothetical protein